MKKLLKTLTILLLSTIPIVTLAASGVDPYLKGIQEKIRSNLDVTTLPPVRCKALYTTALVRFVVQPGGKITNVELTQSSYNPSFDNAILNAVYKSSPLPTYFGPGTEKEMGKLKLITLDFPDMRYLKWPSPVPSSGSRRMLQAANLSCTISKMNF